MLTDFFQPAVGEIYSIKADTSIPIFVLITEVQRWFSRAVRVTLFPQFATSKDIVYKNMLIQTWNSFPVLNVRLDRKIDTVNIDILNEIRTKAEQPSSKDTPILLSYYQTIEINFQNETFLDEDEAILLELYEILHNE